MGKKTTLKKKKKKNKKKDLLNDLLNLETSVTYCFPLSLSQLLNAVYDVSYPLQSSLFPV